MDTTTDFETKLRAEITAIQNRRHDYSIKKFSFATGLLGIGSVSLFLKSGQNSHMINLAPVLYLAP